MQGRVRPEPLQPAVRVIKSVPPVDTFVGRWVKSGRQALVVSVLVFSDVFLALAMSKSFGRC